MTIQLMEPFAQVPEEGISQFEKTNRELHKVPRKPIEPSDKKDSPDVKVIDPGVYNERQELIDQEKDRLGDKAIGKTFAFIDETFWAKFHNRYEKQGYVIITTGEDKAPVTDNGDLLVMVDTKTRQDRLNRNAEQSLGPVMDAQFEDDSYGAIDNEGKRTGVKLEHHFSK